MDVMMMAGRYVRGNKTFHLQMNTGKTRTTRGLVHLSADE